MLLLVVATLVVTTVDAEVVAVVVVGAISPDRCVSLVRALPLPVIDKKNPTYWFNLTRRILVLPIPRCQLHFLPQAERVD